MDTQLSIERFISNAGSGTLGRIVSDLSDIAVVVDGEGTVLDVPHVREPAIRLAPEGWRGRPFSDTLVASSRPAAGDLLARLREGASSSGDEIIHAGPDRLAIRYGGTALEGSDRILLVGKATRPAPVASEVDFGALFSAGAEGEGHPVALAELLRHGADLVVLVDAEGRLLWANDAFHVAAEISHVTGIGGRFLEDLVLWQSADDLDSLMARASAGGTGPAAATLRGDAGGQLAVTIGLTRLPRAAPPVFGAILRPIGVSDMVADADGGMPDISTMLDQAGQVPLKGLVRETADMVERHCLQAALRLTGNNRSAAARALGISRQALYQKLERFGLADD